MLRSAAAAALAAVGAAAWRAPGDTRPNIVLFFPDSVSAESFGPSYGHPIIRTPRFDAFLNEPGYSSAFFTAAWASWPQCSPSRAAMVTGRHVHTVGHRTMTHLVQPWEQNVWQMLKDAGYSTWHLGKNDMLAADSFNQSFTYWRDGTGVAQGPNPYTFGEAGYYSFAAGASTHSGNDTQANGDLASVVFALALLNSSALQEPFALFLPGIGAHPPYGVPADWAGLYTPEEFREKAPLLTLNQTTGEKPPYMLPGGIRAFRNYSTFDEDFAYQMAVQYAERVSYSDFVFGHLLDGLDALGLSNRTAVALSSDHGDFGLDFGLVEKWSGSGDDRLLRVPLALRVPGGSGSGGPVRVDTPVQLFDVFPTFLELAGVDGWLSNANNVTGYVQFGNSLLPWLNASAGQPQVHQYVFAEGGYYWLNEIEYNDPTQNATWQDPHQLYYPRGQEEHLAPSHIVRLVAMRNASYHMVYRARGQGAPNELYDLASDPRCLHNVWGLPAYATVQAQMLADLLDWLVLTSDVTPGFYDSRGLPPSPAWPPQGIARPREAARGGIRGSQ